MNILPNKPIEKIFIHVTGDQSVGIPNSDFMAEVFIESPLKIIARMKEC